ncbi:10336_t:CDS:2, partial [Racocetra fulgida]
KILPLNMSTNPTPQNILCLKNLALNILKNGFPEVIAEGVEVLELDPCSNCLEDYVKDLPQCPECAMEIESIDYTRYSGTSEPSSQDQAQNTSDPMQISPQMAQMTS